MKLSVSYLLCQALLLTASMASPLPTNDLTMREPLDKAIERGEKPVKRTNPYQDYVDKADPKKVLGD